MKILIVEDDPNVAHVLSDAIEAAGYDAVVAYSGEQGVAQAAAEDVDGVFLDFLLPGIHGLEVLRRLRASFPDLPVVILTGYVSAVDRLEAGRLGVAAIIEKPAILAGLPDALREIAARRR